MALEIVARVVIEKLGFYELRAQLRKNIAVNIIDLNEIYWLQEIHLVNISDQFEV